MFRCASIVTSLALLVTGVALAKPDLRPDPTSSDKRVPTDEIKGVDAYSIENAAEGRLEIVERSNARILSKQRVRLQGVGDAMRFNIRYEITVHNPGNVARQFRIITEVWDEPKSRSAQFEVHPGQRIRKDQTVMFAHPVDDIPPLRLNIVSPGPPEVTVRLIDAAGRELDRIKLYMVRD